MTGEYYTYSPDNAKYGLSYIEDSKGVVIVECYGNELAWEDGDMGEVITPSEINGKTVYRIGKNAFWNCHHFTGSLVLPAGLQEIGEYAFGGGYENFDGCEKFTGNLVLPTGLVEIGDGAFFKCSGFSGELELPAGLKKIGDYAFERCSGFTGNLELPDSLTEIGRNAFYGCSGFTGKLKLPENLTEIRECAFCGCSGFTGELKLPENLTEIGAGAFDGCSGFSGDLKLPDGLTRIESYTFYNCSGFNGKLTLPANLTEIGVLAFSGKLGSHWQSCGFVGNLELPDNLTKIDVGAFEGCRGFRGSLKLPESLAEIGPAAFLNCAFTGSLNLPNNLTIIGEDAFWSCGFFSGDLIIPASVESIGSKAFADCVSLSRDIYLTSNVRNIENDDRGVSAFERIEDLITGERITNEDITIHAPRGSYAETYAIENGYSYTDYNGYVHIGTSSASSTKPDEGNNDDNTDDDSNDDTENHPDDNADDDENPSRLPPSTAPIDNTTEQVIILKTPLPEANNAAAIENDQYLQVRVYGDVGENARELINSVAEGAGVKVASIFDIILQVMAQNGAPLREVNELNTPLTFTIAAPEGVDGNVYDFAVLRIHNGQVTILPDLDSDAATITFASDRFSVYAVVYGAKGSFAASRAAWDSVPKTEDKLPPVTVPATITLILVAMAIVFGKKELFGKVKRTRG